MLCSFNHNYLLGEGDISMPTQPMIIYAHLGLDLKEKPEEVKQFISARMQQMRNVSGQQTFPVVIDVVGGQVIDGKLIAKQLFNHYCLQSWVTDVLVVWNCDPSEQPAMRWMAKDELPSIPVIAFSRRNNEITIPTDDIDLNTFVLEIPKNHIREWRVLMILQDGRRVYMSKRDRIDYRSTEQMEQLNLVPGNLGVYSSDLSAYGTRDILKQMGYTRFVPVVSFIKENIKDPIDPKAVVMGGKKPRISKADD